MLDAIIISDLHLGSRVCQVDVLESFFRGMPPTARLILNGDVLESATQRLTKRHWGIISHLRDLSDSLELVWVKGNHDWGAESIAHGIGAEFVEHYSFISGERWIICVHGDEWDDFTSTRPIATFFADLLYTGMQTISHKFARSMKQSSKTFVRCLDKVRAGAIATAKSRSGSVACCGHTHHAECVPGVYYNSGCWTEDECHYLIVGNGKVSLYRFVE